MRLPNLTAIVMLGLGLADALAIPDSSANSGSALELFNRAAPACKIGDKACGAGGCPSMKSTLKQTCKAAKKKRPGKVGRALDVADELWDRATNGGKKSKQCPTDKPKKPTKKKPKTKKPKTKKPKTKRPSKVRTRPSRAKKPKACKGRRCRREDEAELLESPTYFHVKDSRDVVNDGVEKLNGFGEELSDEFEGLFGLVKRAGAFIEKRMPQGVKMDEGKGRKWKEGNTMSTTGISACSVLVVYSNVEIAMAHIPPGRLTNGVYTPGEEVTAEHLRKLDGEFSFFSGGAKAIFYYNSQLDPDRVQQVENWLTEKGITASERDIKDHVGGFGGSGHFEVTHRGNGKKATVSFG
ncbi:hypothetical protein DPSP01_013592 [Paraphaeosphaeria sporulosa]|uniref:Uncharacterized protein n=1 Tax=Paraphaeosphaeria sporulosa TaxID=1460663 RepID=A0A177D134_9PLEO|nr:uncharacterized protein CC84DRAFT_1255228 [Paraphaeosphaeria sporulosa]OAG13118.1 hypothetical protein CC84DRAFT_1255228 [Paraphaeosphaeria sporulosa]